MQDIDETIYISNKAQTSLCYILAGFTVSMGNHFYLITRLKDLWYKYNDMLTPKITEWQKNTSLGKLNTVFYILHPELCIS